MLTYFFSKYLNEAGLDVGEKGGEIMVVEVCFLMKKRLLKCCKL